MGVQDELKKQKNKGIRPDYLKSLSFERTEKQIIII